MCISVKQEAVVMCISVKQEAVVMCVSVRQEAVVTCVSVRQEAVVTRYRRSPSPKGAEVMSSRPRDMHCPPKWRGATSGAVLVPR